LVSCGSREYALFRENGTLELGAGKTAGIPGPFSRDDRVAFAKRHGLDDNKVGFGDFTKPGSWDVDDVLRPIF